MPRAGSVARQNIRRFPTGHSPVRVCRVARWQGRHTGLKCARMKTQHTQSLSGRRALSFTLVFGLCSLGSNFALAQTSTANTPANGNAADMSQNTSGSTANGDVSKLSHSDRHFIEKAAKGGMAEVDYGQLGSEHSADPRVKAFADKMVTDHTKVNQELQELAARKGVTLPQSDKVTDSHGYKTLSAKTGGDFDQHYINMMVDDHHEDIELFQKAAKSNDPEIAAFASKTLPTLEEHQRMAQDLQNSLKR